MHRLAAADRTLREAGEPIVPWGPWGLDAPDRLLHVRGKILHAETRACNANIRKSGGELFRDIARIKLERMLTQGRKIEANVELRDEIAQSVSPENRWRATTPVEMDDTAAPRVIRDEIDFLR